MGAAQAPLAAIERWPVSDFATEIPEESSDILGSPVGVLPVFTAMVGQASQTRRFEARLPSFSDGMPASFVLIVGGDVADAGMEANRIPVPADDGELGQQESWFGRLVDCDGDLPERG